MASDVVNSGAASTDDGSFTEAEYKAARKQFSDSRYGDIRTAGTKLMDLMWANFGESKGNDAGLGVLFIYNTFMSDYADLTTACANHGVTLPPLTVTASTG